MTNWTPEQLYDIWAPPESVWSPWVPPPLFHQVIVPKGGQAAPPPEERPVDWYDGTRVAAVLDLPGSLSIRYGMRLARSGFRPVPMFNSVPSPTPFRPAGLSATEEEQMLFMTPDPFATTSSPLFSSSTFVTLEMGPLAAAFEASTSIVKELYLPPNAPPAFLLDERRITGHHMPMPNRFDNRWMVFPQDFPSASFLKEQGITSVVLVVERTTDHPQRDLAHVLRRWQEGGLSIQLKSIIDHEPPQPITVHLPSRFRILWYRALAMLDFRRNSAGGFGSIVPDPSSSGGGFG